MNLAGCYNCAIDPLASVGAQPFQTLGAPARTYTDWNREFSNQLGWCVRADIPQNSPLYKQPVDSEAVAVFVVNWQIAAKFNAQDQDARLGPITLARMISEARKTPRTALGISAYQAIRFPPTANILYPPSAPPCGSPPFVPAPVPVPEPVVVPPDDVRPDPVIVPHDDVRPDPVIVPPVVVPRPAVAESSGKMWALIALAAGAGLLLLRRKK